MEASRPCMSNIVSVREQRRGMNALDLKQNKQTCSVQNRHAIHFVATCDPVSSHADATVIPQSYTMRIRTHGPVESYPHANRHAVDPRDHRVVVSLHVE